MNMPGWFYHHNCKACLPTTLLSFNLALFSPLPLQNLSATNIWGSLGLKTMSIKCTVFFLPIYFRSSSECLDSALNVLARALENNKENSEIWCHYLKLFSKRGTKEEVQEMCETAVEYAPNYKIWWTVSLIFDISTELTGEGGMQCPTCYLPMN